MKAFLSALGKNFALTFLSVVILFVIFMNGVRVTNARLAQRHAEQAAERAAIAADRARASAEGRSPQRIIVERDDSFRRVGGRFGN